MLQNIRDKSQGIVVKIIVGFIVVTFALFGVDALVQSFTSSQTAAKVDGVEITRSELLQAAETQRRQLISMMGGDINPALLEDNFLQRRALDELVERLVLSNQAKELGLGVSDAQVDQYLLQAEQFQTNGIFDQNKYLNFIRSLGFTPLMFKERIKQDVLIQQPSNAIAGSEFVLPYQVSSVAKLQTQERSFDYVTFSLAEQAESMSVSDEELRAYYENNKQNFVSPEQVKINYVVISNQDFYSKIDITEAELQNEYQASIAGLAQEERLASHILIDTADRSDAQAQALVDEIRTKLVSGESFSALAAEYSDDIGSKNDGGNLGYLTPGSIDAAFDSVLFSMSEGETELAKSQFGFHLISLDAIVQPDVPSFESQKAILQERLLEGKSRNALLVAHEDIIDLAYASDNLEVIAREYGVDILQSDYFDRNGGTDFITGHAEVISAAFSATVLQDNLNSNLIELNEDEVAVIHLEEYKAESLLSYEETVEQITSALVQEKALVTLREKAEAASLSPETEWTAIENAKRGQNRVTALAFELPHPRDSQPVVQIKSFSNGDLALIRLNTVSSGVDLVSEDQLLAYERYLNQTQATMSEQSKQSLLVNSANISR